MKLSGKVAILSGAAVGLGRAVVTRFAHEGAAVVAVDTNVQDGRAVIEQIRKNGGCGIFVRADIADESEVIAAVAAASAEFKRIDVLYNNAAVLFHDRAFSDSLA